MSALSVAFNSSDLFRLSVEQYHELIDCGILGSQDRVELLEGVLVLKMSKNDPHIAAARRCRRALESLLPEKCFYEAEQPIVLADGEPEPDGVVILGSVDDPRLLKPQPADVALVIEIADSSLSRDRGIKLRSYARAGIVCYWIINLIDRQIEVFNNPDQMAQEPTYRDRGIFKSGLSVSLVIDGASIADVSVDSLLPPA